MFVLGGQVNGGLVYGNWPGLSTEQLYDRRDLAITTDYRSVLSEILIRRLQNQPGLYLPKVIPAINQPASSKVLICPPIMRRQPAPDPRLNDSQRHRGTDLSTGDSALTICILHNKNPQPVLRDFYYVTLCHYTPKAYRSMVSRCVVLVARWPLPAQSASLAQSVSPDRHPPLELWTCRRQRPRHGPH